MQIRDTAKDRVVEKQMKLLSNDEIFSFLNNESASVSIGTYSGGTGISYLPIKVSAEGSSYKVVMDYLKYATLPFRDESDKLLGYRKIGVGLRMISEIKTFEANLNIGDLNSIGAAIQAKKASGCLSIEIIGIKSNDVTNLIPLPTEINQTTIQTAMQAFAAIKAKIYDKNTGIYPQIVALKLDTANLNRSVKKIQVVDTTNGKTKEVFVEAEAPAKPTMSDWNKMQVGKSSKYIQAKELEYQGFVFLFGKDINKSIEKFSECYKIFPTYHCVDEILKYLKKEKDNLSSKDKTQWKSVYSTILKQWSWGVTNEIKNMLQSYTDESEI